MAGFEFARIGTVSEVARDWKIGRYIPLYLAGIIAGAAIGLGLTHFGASPGTSNASSRVVVAAPVGGTGAGQPALAAANQEPPAATGRSIPNSVTVTLPGSFEDLFATHVAPATVVAAPVQKPAAAAPVAIPAPASAPQAQAPHAPGAPAAAPAAAPAVPGPNFYVPAVSAGALSVMEQQLFDGLNAQRAKAGLAPYTLDAGLTKIARTRSQQMVHQNYFAHTDPYGYTMYTALLKYYGYATYNWAGENLALNNYPVSDAVAMAVSALMASPTHRANILATDFFRIGIGESDTADGRHIFSMIFLG